MWLGIISYLPHNAEMRERRLRVHNNQLEWLRKTFTDLTIFVVAQNYHESDYNGIVDKYISVEPCGPSKARNYLLETLYNSDQNFMCVLDNDITLYDYYNPQELLQLMDKYPQRFENVDMVESLSPVRMGFKEFNTPPDHVLRYWTFDKQYKGTTQHFAIFKNIKKWYGKEIYYSVETFAEFGGAEDTEIGCHFTSEGFNVVRCNQLIENSTEYDYSTIFFDKDGNHMSHEDRSVLDRKMLKSIVDRYDYLDMSPTGTMLIKYKPKTTHKNNLYGFMRNGKITSWSIPRLNDYVLPENLIWKPRQKDATNKLKKKLF